MGEGIEKVREYDDWLRTLEADLERQAECGWDHGAVCQNCNFDSAGPERATIAQLTAENASLQEKVGKGWLAAAATHGETVGILSDAIIEKVRAEAERDSLAASLEELMTGWIADIRRELIFAHAKFPDQHLPDGTNHEAWASSMAGAKAVTDLTAQNGTLTWLDVLREEVFEAFAEEDWPALRAELVQVAAMAVRWIEDGDSR